MQSYAWDPFNQPLGFGSLVPESTPSEHIHSSSHQTHTCKCTHVLLLIFLIPLTHPLKPNGRLQTLSHPAACLSRSRSATCRQTTQRHPTRFNTRTTQYPSMRLPAVSCACRHHLLKLGRSRPDLLIQHSPHAQNLKKKKKKRGTLTTIVNCIS